MQATLTFNLEEVDDKTAHLRCVKSTDMAIALWEMQCNLLKRCERKAEELNLQDNEHVYNGMQIVLEQISDIFSDNNIIVDELIS